MQLALASILGMAVRYGVVASIGALAMQKAKTKHDQKNVAFEASFDQIDDGLQLYRTTDEQETQFHAHHGHRRNYWLGRHGFEFDTRLLGRLRIRKLKR